MMVSFTGSPGRKTIVNGKPDRYPNSSDPDRIIDKLLTKPKICRVKIIFHLNFSDAITSEEQIRAQKTYAQNNSNIYLPKNDRERPAESRI